MAIIGKIRKHSGLAVVIIGVAIAAFVIGDFGKKQSRGTNDIGVVNGENIPYAEFSTKVDEMLEAQKENTGTDKITDQETYQIREQTWKNEVKNILMGEEFSELGLTVSPEELFDQIQGRQPHRYILQYFKDPKTGMYDPAIVLNYLKNLDKMEPKARDQWYKFEKAIKEDRLDTKFNNLLTKAYYVPKAFLKKEYALQTRALKVRFVSPNFYSIPDSVIKLTDADYQKFYDKNKVYFWQDEPLRDLDFVVFDVKPSDIDRKRTAEDVAQLYKDFETSSDAQVFANANSDTKVDTAFVKKGTLPGMFDSLMFAGKPGTLVAPFELNNTWYMGKLLDMQERPDSMSGSQILIAYAGTGNEAITRTKDQAKAKADSIINVLKKNSAEFANIARATSDYPTAKEDGGDLKWFTDGNPNYGPFFNAGITMKPKDIKLIETRIGYAVFMMNEKTKPVKKVKAAVVARNIEPSNQTFQDTYMKASAFAGQNKTMDAFEKTAASMGLQKRNSPNVKEMDNYLMGLPSAREVVRWAFAETTKAGEVSPVFDLTGKYAVAVVKSATKKGEQPIEDVKARIEPSVRNMKKIDMLAADMSKAITKSQDINMLAGQLGIKVDTTILNFIGFNRSAIGRENEVIGQLFASPTGKTMGPVIGNYGVYFIIIDEVSEPPAKEDFAYELMQKRQQFEQRVTNNLYPNLEKTAKITDNRVKFY